VERLRSLALISAHQLIIQRYYNNPIS
jgi:hypothetical protein